ncbi:MAG: tyrosine-type recombinase/integrase [Planctomycetaceae bacterium]
MGHSRNERGLIAIVTQRIHRSEGVPAVPSATSFEDPAASSNLPAIIERAGPGARFAFEEFFHAKIRNSHTRRAYQRAVLGFLQWCEQRRRSLHEVSPADCGIYLDELKHSVASKKQILAGLRHFFDGMVTRHAIALNPALSVRGERCQVLEGKTPEITIKQARKLLSSINTDNVVGLRDKAIMSILIYTASRIGAVARLRLKDLYDVGDQYCLRFIDKGGKSREIPVRHDLQQLLLLYLRSRGLQTGDTSDRPMFCTARKNLRTLNDRPMSAGDMSRMVKRRLISCGLPPRLSPHSFRVTTITDLLSQGVPLEDVQHLAGHADPRTTRLYDRRQKTVTRNIVERISV